MSPLGTRQCQHMASTVSNRDRDSLHSERSYFHLSTFYCSAVSCDAQECQPLCRHCYHCTCFGFQTGHLCKHIHKIRSHLKATHKSKETQPVVEHTESMVIKQTETNAAVNIPAKAMDTPGKSNGMFISNHTPFVYIL